MVQSVTSLMLTTRTVGEFLSLQSLLLFDRDTEVERRQRNAYIERRLGAHNV